MPLRYALTLTALLALAACSDGTATQSGGTLPPTGGGAQPDPVTPLPGVDPIDLSGTGTVDLGTGQGIAATQSSSSLIGTPTAAALTLTTVDGRITGLNVAGDGVTLSIADPFQPITFELGGATFRNSGNGTEGILRTGILSADGSAVAPLEYMVYGAWSEQAPISGSPIDFAAVHSGNRTPTGRIPSGGSATYEGSAVGVLTAHDLLGGTNNRQDYHATVALSTTDFQNFDFETSNSTLDGRDDVSSLIDLSGTLSRNGTGLSGTVVGSSPGYTGSVDARFYGPDADEIGGVFSFGNDTESTVASFGASRDPAFVSP